MLAMCGDRHIAVGGKSEEQTFNVKGRRAFVPSLLTAMLAVFIQALPLVLLWLAGALFGSAITTALYKKLGWLSE